MIISVFNLHLQFTNFKFLLSYFYEIGCAAPNFVEKNAKFRNKTVHKGYIPSQKEAKEYLMGAFKYILDIVSLLKSRYQESMMLVIQRNINEIRDKEKRYPVSIMANSSVINLLSGEPGWETRNFDAELQKFQEKNIKEEEIIFLTNKQVQIEKANNPKGFFRSVNLKEKTEYRLISTETCSIC